MLKLIPEKVDCRVIRIGFLKGPPGSVGPEQIFYERAIVALAYVEYIAGYMFSDGNLEVVGEVDKAEEVAVLLMLFKDFGLDVYVLALFLLNSFLDGDIGFFEIGVGHGFLRLFLADQSGGSGFLEVFLEVGSVVVFVFYGGESSARFGV